MGVKTFTHNSPAHSQEMLGKLNMLRNDGHFCDITIRVQDKIFRAHKVVLAACSDFFRSKLVGQAEDEGKSVLDLHHVTVTGFIPLLEYAYTATLSINTENIIDVLAAASYMQMFSVASTCSEFMKSSILWNTPTSQQEKVLDAGQENSGNCNFASRDGSLSPVSSECSVVERTIPVCRESRRKRKSYIVMSPESPLKCGTQTSSPQVLNPSAPYPESRSQPVDSSLAFPWTFPFGIDRRLQSEKAKQAENSRTLDVPGPSEPGRRMEYVTCESTKASSPLVIEEDVRVKVERLSDEEVHEEVSQPVSASQSSLSDQQTVPGSEQVQEDLLISPQSSSIGSIDEGVTEGLPTLQSSSGTNAHADDDDRLENVQYPYQLYIAPSTSSTERPSPNGPDRPFQCPTCGVRFTRIQNLKQHMLIHSELSVMQSSCVARFPRRIKAAASPFYHHSCCITGASVCTQSPARTLLRGQRQPEKNIAIKGRLIIALLGTSLAQESPHIKGVQRQHEIPVGSASGSDFLVPDYLNQEQEETLGQYELGEHGFESNSSVQMPVISQVSSTQNCESTFPLGSLGGLAEKEEDVPEQPKTNASAEA
ncbi:ZBT44 protein, partial [Sapayoa aenigma]|nr:ZBT44 protein [Sapayoa aenigma]